MATKTLPQIPDELLEAIRDFPVMREVEHCGQVHSVSSLDMYFKCPTCGAEKKLRAFSASAEIEDLFDALFAWMKQPGASEVAQQRQQDLEEV